MWISCVSLKVLKIHIIQQLRKLEIDWTWLLKCMGFLLKKHFWSFPPVNWKPISLCFSALWGECSSLAENAASQCENKQGKSPGVSIRSTQSGCPCFPGVQGGAGRREVLLRLICCWAGDHSLKKSRPTELEVTVFFSQITGCSQTWYTRCSALNKEMCWFFPPDFMLLDY